MSEELMADIDKVISLVPGKPKMNLHASYAIVSESARILPKSSVNLAS